MNIVFTIDKNYLQHMFVTLKSIVENTSSNLEVYVVNKDLEKKQEELLKINFENVKFHFIKIDTENLLSLGVNTNHLSVEVLFRLIFADILPSHIEKAIFIDSDIIVRDDLAKVYNTDITDYPLAAVVDLVSDHFKNIDLENESDYFNAGFLLINFGYWRKNNYTTKFLEFSQSYLSKLRYADQDILNGVIAGEWIRLNPRWNVLTNFVKRPDIYEEYFTKEEYETVKSFPAVVHFTGGSKPWHISCDSPFKNLYFEYLEETPFGNYKVVLEETLALISQKEDIYIWGAGETGKKVLNHLNLPIKGFIDSDSAKKGTTFYNKRVYSIEEIQKDESIGIIVCSGYYKEISKTLKDKGYRENIDFVHQM